MPRLFLVGFQNKFSANRGDAVLSFSSLSPVLSSLLFLRFARFHGRALLSRPLLVSRSFLRSFNVCLPACLEGARLPGCHYRRLGRLGRGWLVVLSLGLFNFYIGRFPRRPRCLVDRGSVCDAFLSLCHLRIWRCLLAQGPIVRVCYGPFRLPTLKITRLTRGHLVQKKGATRPTPQGPPTHTICRVGEERIF